MALNITITNQGRAEIINAQNTGTTAVTIAAIALGTAQYTPSNKNQTALVAEVKRVTSIAGAAVADDTIHVVAKDESNASYNVGEFGLISDKGTLLAFYSQPAADGWILQKSPASTLLLATDIILESLTTALIEFGDVSFINPPATTTTPGITQLNNTLTSTSTDQALTAAQGKKLQDEKLAASRLQNNATDTTPGAVMTVGAFGLGGTGPFVPDLNAITESGIYGIGGATLNGPPISSGSMCLHMQFGTGNAQQIATSRSSDRTFVRRQNVTEWSAWYELYHTSNLSPVETSRQVTAGNGLTGGGSLAADRTITLGTPGTLSGNTTNSVTAGSHTHVLAAATEALSGVVELATAAEVLAGTDTTRAVTPAGLRAGLLGLGNMGASGHIALPFRDAGGVRRNFIFQWQTVGPLSTQMSPVAVLWPSSFTTVCLGAAATDTGSADSIIKAWKVVEDTLGLSGTKVMFNNLVGTGQAYARLFSWGY